MKKLLFFMVMFVATCVGLSAKSVSVTVFPENATVLFKGKVVLPVSPGVYNLQVGLLENVYTVQADGYDSQQFVINLKSSQMMQIELKPNRKQVSFSADPNTATIYVDGREQGKGVVDFSIYKNETKTVKVELDGYHTYLKQIGFNDQPDIKMSYNVSLSQSRREVNILINDVPAEFWLDGVSVGKGKNTATVTLYDGKEAQLVVRAEGYLEYSRILSFSENVTSYNLTKELAVDEAHTRSVPCADIANVRTEFSVGKDMTREDAIRRIKYYIGEMFETYEVNDNYSGWYRTIWNIEEFPASGKYIRTRVEIKEIPDNGDNQLKFKFLIQSQISTRKSANDEDYKDWNRVLTKYAKLASDLRNLVE